MSISENQDATTHDQLAGPGSPEAEQTESGKRVPAAAKWGMAGLLLVYTGLGSYALVSAIGGSAGPGHPEGVTRSVAVALGKSAAPSRTAASGTGASGTGNWWGQLAKLKSASGAAGPMATAPMQPATPSDGVLTAISAIAVGPGGTSDGDHPELAPLVVDPHSAMSWVTHWYETAHFGNLQDGTGLLIDMGRTVTIRQVELALGGSPGVWGADLQIRVGDSPDLMGLAPVATASDVGGWVTAELQAPATGRYVQVWFTKLPLDQQGTYQEHVYGVTVHGSAPRPSSTSQTTHPSGGHGGGSHGHGDGHGDGLSRGSGGSHRDHGGGYGGGHAYGGGYGGAGGGAGSHGDGAAHAGLLFYA